LIFLFRVFGSGVLCGWLGCMLFCSRWLIIVLLFIFVCFMRGSSLLRCNFVNFVVVIVVRLVLDFFI